MDTQFPPRAEATQIAFSNTATPGVFNLNNQNQLATADGQVLAKNDHDPYAFLFLRRAG